MYIHYLQVNITIKMDNVNTALKRPGISLKAIAEQFDTSTNTVYTAINFHYNSDLAQKIRAKYLEQLQKEVEYIQQTEKIFT